MRSYRATICLLFIDVFLNLRCGSTSPATTPTADDTASQNSAANATASSTDAVALLDANAATTAAAATQIDALSWGSAPESQFARKMLDSAVEHIQTEQTLLQQIAAQKVTTIELPFLQQFHRATSVPVTPEALDQWMALVKQYYHPTTAPSNKSAQKKTASAEQDVAFVLAATDACKNQDEFGAALNKIEERSSAACIVATIDVAIPFADEAVACGVFAINSAVLGGSLLARFACQLLPIHPQYLKVYTGRPCLTQMVDAESHHTSLDVIAVLTTAIQEETILDAAVGKFLDLTFTGAESASAVFTEALKSFFGSRIVDMLMEDNRFAGTDAHTTLQLGAHELAIPPVYVAIQTDPPILYAEGARLTATSVNGSTQLRATLIDWPGLTQSVTSLPIPLRVSAPPKIDMQPLQVHNCQSTEIATTGTITDEDMDAFYFVVNVGVQGRTLNVFSQNAPVTAFYLNSSFFMSKAGSATIDIVARDLCGNYDFLESWQTLQWPTPPKSSSCSAGSNAIYFVPHMTDGVATSSWNPDPTYPPTFIRDDGSIGFTGKFWNQIVRDCEAAHGDRPQAECYQWP